MKCKKLIYGIQFTEDGLPVEKKIVKGIIVDDTDIDFLTFKTRNQVFKVNKRFVISIADTPDEFEDGDYYGNENKSTI